MPSQKETCLRSLDRGRSGHSYGAEQGLDLAQRRIRTNDRQYKGHGNSIRDHGRSQSFFSDRPSDARSASPSKTPSRPRTPYGVHCQRETCAATLALSRDRKGCHLSHYRDLSDRGRADRRGLSPPRYAEPTQQFGILPAPEEPMVRSTTTSSAHT